MSNHACYVCEHEVVPVVEIVHGLKHTVSPVYVGQDRWRHARCEPGGARWMKSKIGKRSELRKYFLLHKKEKDHEEG